MTSLNSLKQKLRPRGVYNLNDNSLISAELSAYSVALDSIESMLSEMEKERFIATATTYGLSMRELTFGVEQSEKPTESRRNMLLYRYAINSEDFNESSIKKVMENVGINGYIIEVPDKNIIYINCLSLDDPSADKSYIKSMVEEFLPAHLDCIFDFRNLQWNTIDGKNNTFNTIDSKNLTWDEIDTFDEI